MADSSMLDEMDQYLLHPSLAKVDRGHHHHQYQPPRSRAPPSSNPVQSDVSAPLPTTPAKPAMPRFDLTWKFEFAFPGLKTSTTSGLFLGKMDTIRRSTADLSLTERILYCQFWCCLISYLEANHVTHAREALWFQCNTHLTDCYWYELLFRLQVAFDALLERMNGPNHPGSVHGDDVAELASKAIGCFAYFQKNTIHFREPELMKAYEVLQEMMVRVRLYALYYLACSKRSDSKRFVSFAVAFLDAQHEFRQTAERSPGWLTDSVVHKMKVDMHKTWTKQLIAEGQLKEAYMVAEEVQTDAPTEFSSLQGCLPSFASSQHHKPRPKRFREPLLAEGFHPHKEPRCLVIDVFAALSKPDEPPPSTPPPPSAPAQQPQPPAVPVTPMPTTTEAGDAEPLKPKEVIVSV
jgi:hypothetical protein